MGIYDRGYYHEEEWRGQRAPITGRSMVVTLIVINAAVFVLDMFSPVVKMDGQPDGGKNQWIAVKLALKTNALVENPQRQLDEAVGVGPVEKPWLVWQLLTYGFVHASVGTDSGSGMLHIAFNMLALFILGRPVEQRYGSQEFLRFYLIALVLAGLVWLMFHVMRRDPGWAVGASGAVAAVVILFVLNFPKQTLLFMGILPMPAWVLGLLFILVDVVNAMNSESHIAVEAHFAGAAFAAAYFYGKWNFRWIKFHWLTNRFSGKPRLKVHAPERTDAKLSDQADQILDKLHREGEQSLTRRERKILERYSKNVRNRRNP